jgi:hypothetical protein
VFSELCQDFSGVGLEITDGFDLGRISHRDPR